jgi:hypothetical protein
MSKLSSKVKNNSRKIKKQTRKNRTKRTNKRKSKGGMKRKDISLKNNFEAIFKMIKWAF